MRFEADCCLLTDPGDIMTVDGGHHLREGIKRQPDGHLVRFRKEAVELKSVVSLFALMIVMVVACGL